MGKNDSFGNGYQKYDKQCYKGGEKHFYGRETLGPAAYNHLKDDIAMQATKSKFASPKTDRGLLNNKIKNNVPGPLSYNQEN